MSSSPKLSKEEPESAEIIDLKEIFEQKRQEGHLAELITALNDGNFSHVSMLSAYFEDKFEFRKAEGFEEAARLFVRKVLENASLTPFVARFFAEGIGQGVDFSPEIRESYVSWLERLLEGEDCDFQISEFEEQFGAEIDFSDLYLNYLEKKLTLDFRKVIGETMGRFPEKMGISQMKDLIKKVNKEIQKG